MAPPWKPQNGFHRGLEISHKTRDSHISTADHRHETEEQRKEDWTAATDSGTLSARSGEGTPGGKGFENPGSIPSGNRHRADGDGKDDESRATPSAVRWLAQLL